MNSSRTAPASIDPTKSRTIGAALHGLMIAAVRSQPRDMSLTSISTLATLEQMGPRRITDLAASEGVMQPSMTALVSGLQRSGLVERRADPADGRVALVALTPAGKDYIRNRRRAGVESFVDLVDALPAAEFDSLTCAINALTHLKCLEEERRGLAT
jgi:DNA-binding MarR family transcriptional regulator